MTLDEAIQYAEREYQDTAVSAFLRAAQQPYNIADVEVSEKDGYAVITGTLHEKRNGAEPTDFELYSPEGPDGKRASFGTNYDALELWNQLANEQEW